MNAIVRSAVGDGCPLPIALTPNASRTLAHVQQALHESNAEFLAVPGDCERRELARLLSKLEASAG